MARLFLILLLTALAVPALAQTTPRAQAETFLGTVQKGQVAAAYAKLFEGSNISLDRDQGLAMRKQTENTLQPLGRVLAYELVREENFGASLTRLVYLLKSERHLTVWEFWFYRPANRWFVSEVNFSEKFNELASKK